MVVFYSKCCQYSGSAVWDGVCYNAEDELLFRWTSVFTADAFCSTGKYMVLFVIQRQSWCFSWGSYLFYEGNMSALSQNINFIHVQSQSCKCMPSHRYQWSSRFLIKSFPMGIFQSWTFYAYYVSAYFYFYFYFLSQKKCRHHFYYFFSQSFFPKLKVIKTSIIIACSSHLCNMPLFLMLRDLILGKIPKWNGDTTMSNECECRMVWENAFLLYDAHSFSEVNKMFLHIFY